MITLDRGISGVKKKGLIPSGTGKFRAKLRERVFVDPMNEMKIRSSKRGIRDLDSNSFAEFPREFLNRTLFDIIL